MYQKALAGHKMFHVEQDPICPRQPDRALPGEEIYEICSTWNTSSHRNGDPTAMYRRAVPGIFEKPTHCQSRSLDNSSIS